MIFWIKKYKKNKKNIILYIQNWKKIKKSEFSDRKKIKIIIIKLRLKSIILYKQICNPKKNHFSDRKF